MKETQIENARMIDPASIFVGSNVRYNLIPARVDSLAEDIVAEGGVHTPIEVSELPDGHESGLPYGLTFGHYRLAAVQKVNKGGGGLLIPAIIKDPLDPVARIKRQLSENQERQNLSPIDTAVAIKEMLDLGVPKPEIRESFKFMGGRKGNALTEMSHSTMSLYLRMLELPKPVRDKIHDGRITVGAACVLVNLPAEKRDATIQKLEADRLEAFEKAEKQEEKFLEAERKVAEEEQKAADQVKALEKAKAEVEEARKKADAAADAAGLAYKAHQKASKEDKEKAKATLTKAEEDSKAAAKDVATAIKAVEKLEGKINEAKDEVEDRKKKLAEAKKTAKPDTKAAAAPVSAGAVKKAAAAVAGNTFVPLKFSDLKTAIHDLSLPDGTYTKVPAIGKIFQRMADGELTPNQARHEIAVITGEKKADAKKK